MKENENWNDLIDDYLSGNLKQEDIEKFDSQLKLDKELVQALNLHQELNRTLVDSNALKLETQLKEIGKDYGTKYQQHSITEKKDSNYQVVKWLVAASILILICISYWIWMPSSVNQTDELFAQHYEPYPISITTRSGDNIEADIVNTLIKNYNDTKYGEALIAINQILGQDSLAESNIAELQFFKGLSYLGRADYSKSAEALKQVLLLGSNEYYQQCQWYLALIALKNKKIDLAASYLNEIKETTNQGKYYNKANQLLKKLEKFH